MENQKRSDAGTATEGRRRRVARILIVVADVGLLLWCAMAAVFPEHLLGPGGTPILAAGYDGYTAGSWQALAHGAPATTAFMTLLFRLFGAYGVAFSVLAIAIAATAFRRGERWAWWSLLVGNTIAFAVPMAYDRIVNAIGPFELLEYVAIAVIYGALAITAPWFSERRSMLPQTP